MVESKAAVITLISMVHVLNFAASDTSPLCDGNNRYVYECECLHFVYTPQLDWQDASDECRKLNAELVTIRTAKKQEFIQSILLKTATKRGVWIGAHRTQDGAEFRWSDNGANLGAAPTFWAPGEPDNGLGLGQSCVLMHRNNHWRWKDYFCSIEHYSYICQRNISCVAEEEDGLSTGTIIGIVVGGIVGVIVSFGLLFFVINTIRLAIDNKRQRERETQPYHEAAYCSPSSCQPTASADEGKKSLPAPANDLDKPVRDRTEAAPLMAANVLPAVVKRNQSLKVSNIEMANLTPTEHQVPQRKRRDSDEDNELTVNFNRDVDKFPAASVKPE